MFLPQLHPAYAPRTFRRIYIACFKILVIRCLLLRHFLGLLLLLRQEGSYPIQAFTSHDERCGDQSLPTGDNSFAATLLIFAGVGVEDIVFAIASKSEGEERQFDHRALELLSFLSDDREGLIDLV